MSEIILDDIQKVAEGLEPLNRRFVLVGGCSPIFFVDAQYRETVRPTMDIDIAVESRSRIDHSEIEKKLRSLGFRHDMRPGSPRCRWIFEEIQVDILPSSPEASEFGSKWFELALNSGKPYLIDEGINIHVIPPACFLAAKMDAFFDRGNNDYYGSEDFEDIIRLLESCSILMDDLRTAPEELQLHVACGMTKLLAQPNFRTHFSAHILPESPLNSAEKIMTTARRIALLNNRCSGGANPSRQIVLKGRKSV